MADPSIAILDACVLYSAFIRDLLMEFSVESVFKPRWSSRIQDEWIAAVIRDNKATPQQLARTRALMERGIPDCLVTGFEPLIDQLSLPDPDDRHVLAAAIVSGAGVIVTTNLKHFPDETLLQFNIEAQHPDIFLTRLFIHSGPLMQRAIKRMRTRLKNPPMNENALLETLARNHLPELAKKLQPFKDDI